ncbi:MAG: hypothetical protein HYR97_00310 [Candidatus Melainabacteria bacterium]|nr:hypothetical protein [Candidatus Melainabacteria bacterium]MBI3308638.1 hypothetical protein [Candidatus Melainabacteria bacterium]
MTKPVDGNPGSIQIKDTVLRKLLEGKHKTVSVTGSEDELAAKIAEVFDDKDIKAVVTGDIGDDKTAVAKAIAGRALALFSADAVAEEAPLGEITQGATNSTNSGSGDENVTHVKEAPLEETTQEATSVNKATDPNQVPQQIQTDSPVTPDEHPEGENQNKLGKWLGIASIAIGALAALGGIFSSEEGTRGKSIAGLIGGLLILLPFLKPLHSFFWGQGEGSEEGAQAEPNATA